MCVGAADATLPVAAASDKLLQWHTTTAADWHSWQADKSQATWVVQESGGRMAGAGNHVQGLFAATKGLVHKQS